MITSVPQEIFTEVATATGPEFTYFNGMSGEFYFVENVGGGVALFDYDRDGDLFMTHLLGETNTLYVNSGEGWFENRSLTTGLAVPSKAFTSFGTAWFDYDNDGWLDIFAANGEVRVVPILARAGDKYPLHR